jgi:hypothetical protein
MKKEEVEVEAESVEPVHGRPTTARKPIRVQVRNGEKEGDPDDSQIYLLMPA